VTARVTIGVAVVLAVTACTGDDGATRELDDADRTAIESEAEPEVEVVAGETEGVELAQPYAGELTFVLPENCGVPVEEQRVESDGTEVDLAYTLTFDAQGMEGRATVVTVDEIDVQQVLVEGLERPAGSVDPVVFERPSLVVEANGQIGGIVGTEELVARLPIPPDAAPMVARGLELDMSDQVWDLPIGVWADLGTIEELESDLAIESPTGRRLIGTVWSEGTVGDLAVLNLVAQHAPDDVEAAVAASFPELAPAIGQAEVAIGDVVEVITDPTTLWPRSVSLDRVAESRIGTDVVRRSEHRSLQFDWAASDC
jgi:hypothetical protein